MRRRFVLSAALLVTLAVPVSGHGAPDRSGAVGHLREILKRSPAPEYRRAGTAGMEDVAGYEAKVLRRAGYRVVRHDVDLGAVRWAVDYGDGHAPLLERLDDGRRFKADSAFHISPTAPEGIACTVRVIAEVGPGDCGFVPFEVASPEWNNAASYDPGGAVDDIIARGGVGAVIQGDLEHDAVMALSLRRALPVVVAVVAPDDVVGRQVRLRVMGERAPTLARNVIGVRRPPAGSSEYVLVLAHADGWYQAAADNGGGVAAALRAAEVLADRPLQSGVVVALVDAEEIGLLGSQRLAEALSSPAGLAVPDRGPPLRMGDIKAAVNLDASSARASDFHAHIHTVTGEELHFFSWRVLVFSEEPVLSAAFLAATAANGVLGLPLPATGAVTVNGSWRTDAKWFHDAGVPVAWPVAGYPEYHTDADTLAAVDPADLEAVTAATIDLVERIGPLPIGEPAPLA